MSRLVCKRGYKRYMDFNHNRFVLLVKGWYNGKLMIDFYYNEQFLDYITTDVSWSDIFSSNQSNSLVLELMQTSNKLKEYMDVFRTMNLSEENLLFIDSVSQLELYVTVPFRQRANLKVCKLFDSEKKQVLQNCMLDAYNYLEVFDNCMQYLEGLDSVTDTLIKLYESQKKFL